MPVDRHHALYHQGLYGQYVSPTDMDFDYEEALRKMLREPKPIRFDWENKWLRGDQYAHMLYNLEAYSRVFGMPKLPEKEHPENIYIEPASKFSHPFLNTVCRRPGVLREGE